MNKELSEILSRMEVAFGRPEYYGELSRARLKSKHSLSILEESLHQLEELPKRYPDEPQIIFLSGICSRYLGDHQAFHDKMLSCLEVDSNFLEAIIAVREGKKYLDPFCYVSLQEVLRDPTCLRPESSSHLAVGSGRLDQVRVGLDIKPIVIFKYQKKKFRREPLQRSESAIGAELCVVTDYTWDKLNKPGTDPLHAAATFTPLMVVCPIVIDDEDDPFWKIISLNLFPVKQEMMGVEVRPLADYQPFLGRYESLRICTPPHLSAIVVFNENNSLLYNKVVNLHRSEESNLLEMRRVLKALPNESSNVMLWNLSASIYEKYFSLHIKTDTGKIFKVPKYRTGEEREGKIFNLMLKGNRIALRPTEKKANLEKVHDLFVSHSHKDDQIVYGLSKWLYELWPDLKIFMTGSSQTEIGQIMPAHYFFQIERSRCALFLCTKHSLDSAYVRLELGAIFAAELPILTVSLDSRSIRDLMTAMNKDLAFKIDLNRVVNLTEPDGVNELISQLRNLLDLPEPASSQDQVMRTLLSGKVISKRAKRDDKPEEFHLDIEGILNPDKQTRENALKWLQMVESEVEHKARMKGVRIDRLPEISKEDVHKRIVLAMLTSDENRYDQLLEPFRPLMDSRIVNYIVFMEDYAKRLRDEDLRTKIEKLYAAIQKLLRKS
jgi:hypothetical protein